MTDEEITLRLFDWPNIARPEQLPPASHDWQIWLVLAGRGWGKSRTGAEFIRREVEAGRMGRIALVARTGADVRDVMVEGDAGLLAVAPPWDRPHYEPSKRRVTWNNGAMATTYSGDKPDQLRGPSHDGAWADEPAAWRYPEAWDHLLFGLRLGTHPRIVATTTPRPTPLIKGLVEDPLVTLTRGHTMDNKANLPPSVLAALMRRYGGTRLGRQELAAEILEDNPDALWVRKDIEDYRTIDPAPFVRVVVGVDPAATSGEESSETGIVVAGLGRNGHGYVLDDMTIKGSPHGWGTQAVTAYHKYEADRLVAETNQGGEMVELTIRTVDRNVSYKGVHASRGKHTRAEPIAALYEQGKVHHVGMFSELEDQMCQWVPGDASPDRLDALVWALTELMLKGGAVEVFDYRELSYANELRR